MILFLIHLFVCFVSAQLSFNESHIWKSTPDSISPLVDEYSYFVWLQGNDRVFLVNRDLAGGEPQEQYTLFQGTNNEHFAPIGQGYGVPATLTAFIENSAQYIGRRVFGHSFVADAQGNVVITKQVLAMNPTQYPTPSASPQVVFSSNSSVSVFGGACVAISARAQNKVLCPVSVHSDAPDVFRLWIADVNQATPAIAEVFRGTGLPLDNGLPTPLPLAAQAYPTGAVPKFGFQMQLSDGRLFALDFETNESAVGGLPSGLVTEMIVPAANSTFLVAMRGQTIVALDVAAGGAPLRQVCTFDAGADIEFVSSSGVVIGATAHNITVCEVSTNRALHTPNVSGGRLGSVKPIAPGQVIAFFTGGRSSDCSATLLQWFILRPNSPLLAKEAFTEPQHQQHSNPCLLELLSGSKKRGRYAQASVLYLMINRKHVVMIDFWFNTINRFPQKFVLQYSTPLLQQYDLGVILQMRDVVSNQLVIVDGSFNKQNGTLVMDVLARFNATNGVIDKTIIASSRGIAFAVSLSGSNNLQWVSFQYHKLRQLAQYPSTLFQPPQASQWAWGLEDFETVALFLDSVGGTHMRFLGVQMNVFWPNGAIQSFWLKSKGKMYFLAASSYNALALTTDSNGVTEIESINFKL